MPSHRTPLLVGRSWACWAWLFAVSPAAVATAAPLADDSPLSAEEALLEDAAAYSQELTVSLEEAVRRLESQPELSQLSALLERALADRFAGSWIEHEPEFRLVVRLKGEGPVARSIASAVAGSPVPVVFHEGASATLRDLESRVAVTAGRLVSSFPGLARTEIDVRTGEVVLFLKAAEEGTAVDDLTDAARAKEILSAPARVVRAIVPKGRVGTLAPAGRS